MKKDKTSILMPVKNAGKFLVDCLNSILNQDEFNWELIAIDDRSEDDSWGILKEYETFDKRIRAEQNKGKGIIEALRQAYDLSDGTFVTRMDADDIMSANKLSELKKLLLKSGTGHVAIGQVKIFSESGVLDGYRKYERWINSLTVSQNNYDDIYKECVIPSPCWMVYSEDLLKVDAFNPSAYPEDYDLCFRFYKNKLKVLSSKEFIHQWRDHPERTSRNDPRYREQTFFELKLNYFLKTDFRKNRELILWGAGRKGKSMARLLHLKEIPFSWVCDNRNKVGKEIYGTKLKHHMKIDYSNKLQIMVIVSAGEEQELIRHYFHLMELTENEDFYFFC